MQTNNTPPTQTDPNNRASRGWMMRLVRPLFCRSEAEKATPEDWTDGLKETLRDDPELRRIVQERLKEEIEKRNARITALEGKTNEQLTMIGVKYLLANAMPFNEPACELIDVMQARIIETNGEHVHPLPASAEDSNI
jgi:hypothetical protein